MFAACSLHENGEIWRRRIHGIYTYGQPRVGNAQFVASLSPLVSQNRVFRFVHSNDFAPHLPSKKLAQFMACLPFPSSSEAVDAPVTEAEEHYGFCHTGTHMYITSRGRLLEMPTLLEIVKQQVPSLLCDFQLFSRMQSESGLRVLLRLLLPFFMYVNLH